MTRLAKHLGVRKCEAVGMVELLHHFTDEYAWRGDLGRFDDDEIAERVDWDGEPSRLVLALIESGLVDRHPVHRLVVHDWKDHCPEYTKKKVRAAAEKGESGWASDDVGTTPPPNDSGKFQNSPENSGLPSHGKSLHGMGRDGTPEPEPHRAAPAQAPAPKPEPQPPPVRAKGKPRPQQTLAPDELCRDDRRRLTAWLERRGFGWFRSQLPHEVETCLGHFRANGAAKADWYATCQNWISRAIEGGGSFPPMDPDRRAAIAERTRKIDAERKLNAEMAAKTEGEKPSLSVVTDDDDLPDLPEGLMVTIGGRR